MRSVGQLILCFCSGQETEKLLQLEHVRTGIMEVQHQGKVFSLQIQTLVFSDNSFPSIPVSFPVLREKTCCFTEKKHGPKC